MDLTADAGHHDETLSEYSARMRRKFSREYVLALSKSLAPAFTYVRGSDE